MGHIDSHNHFWHYDAIRHDWISPEMAVIRRDFLPADFWPVLQANNVEGTVAVQADQTEEETLFLLKLAEENDFIKGVVGWVDLRGDNLEERLQYFSQFEKLKGFRHVLQGEPQRDLMLTESFKRGISKLSGYNFTYDILIFPDQLVYATALVKEFPEQKFVLDHIAKPPIAEGGIDEWAAGIIALAKQPNVWCKVSGMVTEAKWNDWQPEDFTKYLDVVLEAFGPDRIMFGSDWPVCLVAADYKAMKAIVAKYTEGLSVLQCEQIFKTNAIQFYNL